MVANVTVLVARRRGCAVLRSTPPRTFTTTTPCLVNPLLNLSHFSASKEAQYLSKEKKIPREEFHPYLELVRSSEVDPFAPAPGATPTVVAALNRAQTGRSDMQTAYSLAVANLIQQLQHTRKEATQTRELLTRMHDKYKREERNSFLVMLTAVALLSLIFIKTDALQDLKDSARRSLSEWKRFDWEWLGNIPSYKKVPRSSDIVSDRSEPFSSPTTIPLSASFRPVEVQAEQQAELIRPDPLSLDPRLRPNRSAFSRMFWAGSNNSDS